LGVGRVSRAILGAEDAPCRDGTGRKACVAGEIKVGGLNSPFFKEEFRGICKGLAESP
jgi:hypothetical protein